MDNPASQPAANIGHLQQHASKLHDLPRAQPGIPPIGQQRQVVYDPQTENGAGKLVKAAPADIMFVNDLQKKFGKSLGFLPWQALEKNLELGNVNLTTENEDAAGYMLVRPVLSWCPGMSSIVQAAICMDAQRRHHGLRLLLHLEQEARQRGQQAIQANCAVGVEANEFWKIAGFKPIAHLTPATRSQREIICWRKPLTRNLPAWFTVLPRRAGGKGHAVNSTRNIGRKATTAEFAARFLSARTLPSGDPTASNSGLIQSLFELESRMTDDEATNI